MTTFKAFTVSMFLLLGCGPAAESFHISPFPPECEDDGTDWYFVDCPSGQGAICTDDEGTIRAVGCTYSKFGPVYYCVAKCE